MTSLCSESLRSYLGRSASVSVSRACSNSGPAEVTQHGRAEVSRGRSSAMTIQSPLEGPNISNQGISRHDLEPSTTHRSQFAHLIQQAVLQVQTPIFDPGFSESSFGFRPKRSAQDAAKQVQCYIRLGYRQCVDMDLATFFDKVQHDVLMVRVTRKVHDRRLLKLMGSFSYPQRILRMPVRSLADGALAADNPPMAAASGRDDRYRTATVDRRYDAAWSSLSDLSQHPSG